MSGSVESASTFKDRSNKIAKELAHHLNTTTVDINSLVTNWRTLGIQSGRSAQEKALEEALDYLDPSASYAEDDQELREQVENVARGILKQDTILPDPAATPSPEDSQKDSGEDDELDLAHNPRQSNF